MAKPNAGMPKVMGDKTVYDCPPEGFAAYADEMVQAGVGVFGGCCGTDSRYIAALKEALDGKRFVPPAPEHTELLPAATEKLPFLLPVDAGHGPALSAGEDMEEAIEQALEGGEPTLAMHIGTWEDVDELADWQYAMTKPLCLICEDGALLEAALRGLSGPRPVRGQPAGVCSPAPVRQIRPAVLNRIKRGTLPLGKRPSFSHFSAFMRKV